MVTVVFAFTALETLNVSSTASPVVNTVAAATSSVTPA